MLQLLADKLKTLPKTNEDFKESAVALLSLFANLTFQPKQNLLEKLKILKLHEIIYSKFVEGATTGDTLRLGVQSMPSSTIESWSYRRHGSRRSRKCLARNTKRKI